MVTSEFQFGAWARSLLLAAAAWALIANSALPAEKGDTVRPAASSPATTQKGVSSLLELSPMIGETVISGLESAGTGKSALLSGAGSASKPVISSQPAPSVAKALRGLVMPAGETMTTQPAPRGDEWMAKHYRLCEMANKGGIDLYFLGDSVIEAFHKEVWHLFYQNLRAANFGVNGDTTQNILWRLENGELEGVSPRMVVLLAGANNVGSCSVEEVAAGVGAIVNSLHQRLPDAKVMVVGILPRGQKPDSTRGKIAKINAILAKFDDGNQIRFIDVSDKMMDADGLITHAIMPDYVHLSTQGYQVLAQNIHPLLLDMLGLASSSQSRPAK